ncbi:ImmA/IrrE family metallo-endopeptidase [Vibrio campbellii]|uniref:ImmA/IrrE family metallo-endopeptidase n=1 Tax=Vibrio TaxID=662 RepID=UPI0005EE069A|nr:MULTISPECIES: ImmA/IrrE family metallo-endopeptidase [Vibrio]NDJ82365.1 ImmA/IrrE family metallo-endopeptidase [Vibrio sp. LB10LO1]
MKKSNVWSRINDSQLQLIEKYQQELPIKIGALATALGLKVKKSTLAGSISGSIKFEDHCYVIRVNSHDVKARQRFTIAHEVAHFLLHKHLIGDGITDDVLYRSSLPSQIEWEANALAAEILMPWEPLQHEKKKHSVELKKEALHEKLAEIFDVSVTALKYRIDDL